MARIKEPPDLSKRPPSPPQSKETHSGTSVTTGTSAVLVMLPDGVIALLVMFPEVPASITTGSVPRSMSSSASGVQPATRASDRQQSERVAKILRMTTKGTGVRKQV